jgi:hypothetical protein
LGPASAYLLKFIVTKQWLSPLNTVIRHFQKIIFTEDRLSYNMEISAGFYRQNGTKFLDKKEGASKTKIDRKEFPLMNGLR